MVALGEVATIKNVLVGFKIRPQAVAPKSTRPIELEKLEFFYKKYPFNVEFARPMAIAELAQPKDAIALLKNLSIQIK
ncbi:hypothetical protein FA048_06540 [Pedobacter polaris]|uniref:Uncharacterized protein n=1 Tax=Pedobacter polaris TaxID=2571273 RepID=A0A4U1CP93_9SPHI|nr:hypothetical protein [Pedobacter polaris]TKC09867.1 hypothetical protein FA048_06540 [Pedobacter polaris]